MELWLAAMSLISALDPKFQKSYIILPTGKELWDTLVGKFGVTDAGSELYLMEQLYDYKMVENRSKDFATSLKHKRREFNVEELIGTLDVEERARAKDNRKNVETSTTNVVQKRNSGFRKYKKKKNQNKQENTTKPVQTAQFKKKKNNKRDGGCFVCGSEHHWASECPERKFKQEKKSANVVTTDTREGATGYGNSLPFVLSVERSDALLMGNGSRAYVLGVGTVILKFTLGKTMPWKSMQHVSSIKKNLIMLKILMCTSLRRMTL
ncbi:uncharacterized protein [Miscanthus floridulus]|uniref:uncharacterized protein n=1 Tax=Miscanthus floridulus TaxID=154761 RepID=UPI00345A5832